MGIRAGFASELLVDCKTATRVMDIESLANGTGGVSIR